MALGPVTLGGAAGAPTTQRQFGPTMRLRSLPAAGPSSALTENRGSRAGRLSVQITPSQLDIDYTATRESMGYHQPMSLLNELVTYSKKTGAQGIAKFVTNGDRLAKPYTGVNMIAQIGFETMLQDLRTHEFGIGFIPKTPPHITYTPGTTTIDVVY